MKEETKALFDAISCIEEIRELLRQTAPEHRLSDEQKKALKEKTGEIRRALEILEKMG